MNLLLIAFIDDPFDPPGLGRFGGGHYFIFDLARHLVRQGADVTFITRLNRLGKPEFQEISARFRIHRLAVGPATDLGGEETGAYLLPLVTAMHGVLRGQHYDAVHSQYWISGIAGVRWTVGGHTLHVHAPVSFGRKVRLGEVASSPSTLRDSCELEVFRAANQVVLTSPDEMNTFAKLYPEVGTANVTIIPCGIDREIFYPRPGSPDNYLRRQSRRV